VLYLWLIIFSVGDDVSIDGELFLVTDFVNLKIKLAQSFRCAHKNKICICIFIWVSVHTYMNSYVYTVFLKKKVLSSLLSSGQCHLPLTYWSLPQLIM
jgi:hypothetical protein